MLRNSATESSVRGELYLPYGTFLSYEQDSVVAMRGCDAKAQDVLGT